MVDYPCNSFLRWIKDVSWTFTALHDWLAVNPILKMSFGWILLRSSFFARRTRSFFSNHRRPVIVSFFQVQRLSMPRDRVPSLTPLRLGPVTSAMTASTSVPKEGLLSLSCLPSYRISPPVLRSQGLQSPCCRPTSRDTWIMNSLPEVLLLGWLCAMVPQRGMRCSKWMWPSIQCVILLT